MVIVVAVAWSQASGAVVETLAATPARVMPALATSVEASTAGSLAAEDLKVVAVAAADVVVVAALDDSTVMAALRVRPTRCWSKKKPVAVAGASEGCSRKQNNALKAREGHLSHCCIDCSLLPFSFLLA